MSTHAGTTYQPRTLKALLNIFLQREIDAESAYPLAVGLLAPRNDDYRLLEDVSDHHGSAAEFFRDYLTDNGARPMPIAEAGNPWARFGRSSELMRDLRLRNPAVARLICASLRECELETLQDYRRAVLCERKLTEEVRDYLDEIVIPRGSRHVGVLEVLLH